MLDEQLLEAVGVDRAVGEGLVEASMGAAELGLETQRWHRVQRCRCAQGCIGEFEQGVRPTGQTPVEPGTEPCELLEQRLCP